MYVTLVQNISASMRSVSSLCDSLKHLNLHQTDPFLSQNLAITCYSILYEKRTLFICIYLYKIDTSPATYLIGARRRRTSNTVLSHTSRANKLERCAQSHTHIFHISQGIYSIYTQEFLSFILNKNKTILTIKAMRIGCS